MYIKLNKNDIAEIRQQAIYACRFCFVNIGVEIYSDNSDTIENYKAVYTNFIAETLQHHVITCYILNRSANTNPCVVIGDMLYELPSEGIFSAWSEMIIFQRLLEQIDTHFLLHAGVVSKDDRATIIYAPSGFGKTTLVLELVSRGYKFLSDEFCPVALDDFTIMPFPRRVGLKTTSPFLSGVPQERGFVDVHEQKIFFDCDDIFPGCIGGPCRSNNLILLTHKDGYAAANNSSKVSFEMMLFQDSRSFYDDLSQYEEIQIIDKVAVGSYVRYQLTMPKNNVLIKTFNTIWKKHANDIFFVGKTYSQKPDFNSSPEIRKIPGFDAIIEMIASLLNRSPTSALMKKFDNKTTKLLLNFGNVFKNVNCYKMKPGTLTIMADMVDKLYIQD